MAFRLFNTLTRKKEEVRANGAFSMYTCGPTVYDYAHIGNMRAYLFYDLLKRYLKYREFRVKHVMNLTDVDDKTIKGAREAGVALKEYTERYAAAFFQDLTSLRIQPADVYPRATEHVNGMVEMIRKLMLRGYAYKGEDGSIYFSIAKFRPYGKLSKLKQKDLKPESRVRHDEYTKEHAHDFSLWKAYSEEDGDVYWVTPLGKGRPGWHIECSVMSAKYLKTIDLHGGGVDLIFPHHENEIAQYEAATGRRFVRYWVHCNHLYVDGRKMSKSLGNFYTLRDLLARGADPVAFRYLCMSSHYRSQLNFTFQSLEKASSTVASINDFARRILWTKDETKAKPNHRLHVAIRKARDLFEKAMDNDLNTPDALAAFFGLMKATNKAIDSEKADRKSLIAIHAFVVKVNSILDVLDQKDMEITEEEEKMIEQREEMRKNKRFEEADRIRSLLRERGIVLEDTAQGARWRRIK